MCSPLLFNFSSIFKTEEICTQFPSSHLCSMIQVVSIVTPPPCSDQGGMLVHPMSSPFPMPSSPPASPLPIYMPLWIEALYKLGVLNGWFNLSYVHTPITPVKAVENQKWTSTTLFRLDMLVRNRNLLGSLWHHTDNFLFRRYAEVSTENEG